MSHYQHLRSSISGRVPLASELQVGEIAINLADATLYTKTTSEQIISVGGGGSGGDAWTRSVTSTSKIITNLEKVMVTAPGQIITLPAAPSVWNEVSISVGDFSNTVIAGNGSKIMGLPENFVIDAPWVTVDLYYVDASRGWDLMYAGSVTPGDPTPPPVAVPTWTTVSVSGQTLTENSNYFIDTSGGPITVTLPGSPVSGNVIGFIDYARTFNISNLTIAGNGSLIEGSGSNMIVSSSGANFQLIYADASQGWKIFGTA